MRSAERMVAASTITPPTGAAPWRRAAVLTTSPATIPSPRSGRAPRATTASPVVTAARTATSRPSPRSPSMVSRMRSAARTARSASSSCAMGAPKTAMTASPMNFSTVPPKLSMSALTRSWYGAEGRADVLRVSTVGAVREADEIDEQHRDDLPFLSCRNVRRQRLTAVQAEPCSLRVLLAQGSSWRTSRRLYAAGGSGSSSSSASRRWRTLRESTPISR